MTKTELQQAAAKYEEGLARAQDERARIIRQASAEGMQQKDIIEATGYSRETVRRILNPRAVEATKQRRRNT